MTQSTKQSNHLPENCTAQRLEAVLVLDQCTAGSNVYHCPSHELDEWCEQFRKNLHTVSRSVGQREKKGTYFIDNSRRHAPSFIRANEKVPSVLVSMIRDHDNDMNIILSELSH